MDPAIELPKLIRNLIPSLPADYAIQPDTPLSKGGLELDSVAVFELLVACDDFFGIQIPEEIFEKEVTVGTLASVIGVELARQESMK